MSYYVPGPWEKFVIKYGVSRYEAIASLLPAKIGILLDVPCGAGEFLTQEAFRCREVRGLDIFPRAVKDARESLRTAQCKVEIKVHDVDKGLPYQDNTIDVVTCDSSSIGCFKNPEFFLDEVKRILKKNGRLVIQIGNYAFLSRRLALFFGRLPKISAWRGFGDGGMIHYFTDQVMKELLVSHGFEVEKTIHSGILPPVRKIWPTLLAADFIYRCRKS